MITTCFDKAAKHLFLLPESIIIISSSSMIIIIINLTIPTILE